MNNTAQQLTENVTSSDETIFLDEKPALQAPFYIGQLPSQKAVCVPADVDVKKIVPEFTSFKAAVTFSNYLPAFAGIVYLLVYHGRRFFF